VRLLLLRDGHGTQKGSRSLLAWTTPPRWAADAVD
jgi:hypothetical protein